MGFYLRKSFRAGPIRFNLSKSGIGFPLASPAPVSVCRRPAEPMCTGDVAGSTTDSRSVRGPGSEDQVLQGTSHSEEPLPEHPSS